MRQTRQEVEFSERRRRRGSKQGGLRPSRRIVTVSQFSPSSERVFFMPKSLYDKDLALFEILLASLSAETGTKNHADLYRLD